MTRLMKNKCSQERTGHVLASFLMLCMLIVMFTATVHADTGPKPSVHITIKNLPERTCFATLLGDSEGYGPYSAVEPGDGSYGNTGYDRAFNAFRTFAEQDDEYYFWGNMYELKSNGFSWTYYPPSSFRILIYDDETGDLYVSDTASRYAFDSFYAVTLESDKTITVKETPQVKMTILSFFVRVTVTILVELLIAMLFGYREKKEIRLIIIVNIITQVLLNLILAFTDYTSGMLVWLIFFPVLEIVVFIIEAIAYAVGLKSHSKKRAVGYAFVANLVTALAGVMIGVLIR